MEGGSQPERCQKGAEVAFDWPIDGLISFSPPIMVDHYQLPAVFQPQRSLGASTDFT